MYEIDIRHMQRNRIRTIAAFMMATGVGAIASMAYLLGLV